MDVRGLRRIFDHDGRAIDLTFTYIPICPYSICQSRNAHKSANSS